MAIENIKSMKYLRMLKISGDPNIQQLVLKRIKELSNE